MPAGQGVLVRRAAAAHSSGGEPRRKACGGDTGAADRVRSAWRRATAKRWSALPLPERRKRLEAFAPRNSAGTSASGCRPRRRSSPTAKKLAQAGRRDARRHHRQAARHALQSGDRHGMQKIKNYRIADCVVGGFRYNEGKPVVGSLLLGLYNDDGLLDHVGFTSTIAREDKPALTAKLEKLIAPPGFTGNTPGGPSRWSTERSARVAAAEAEARRRGLLRPFHRRPLPPRHAAAALAARQIAEAMHDGQVEAEEGGPDEAAEVASLRRRAVLAQHVAGEIERAGDQDARRRIEIELAHRVERVVHCRGSSAGIPTRARGVGQRSAGKLLSCRGIGTAMRRRASPAKLRRKPASPWSPACRRSAPAAATRAPRDRRAPLRWRGRRRDCGRRRARARCPAAPAPTSCRCDRRCMRAGQSALAMPASKADGGSVKCRSARKRRDGEAGILELMAAVELRRRQIEQAVVVLIDQAAALLGARSSPRRRCDRRAQPRAPAARSRRARRVGLRRDDRRHAALEDAGLLGGDLLHRVAEKFGVIDRDRRDRRWRAACSITLVASSRPPSPTSSSSTSAGWRENSRKPAAVVISNTVIGAPPLARSHSSSAAASSSSATSRRRLRAEPEALVEAHQMRRGVDVHALAGRFQDRAHEGDGRALAVGAGDMDHRRQFALGMAERGEQCATCDRATGRCAWDAARAAA